MSLFGVQSVAVLSPLLEQGLAEANENVLSACLRALDVLQRRCFLSAPLTIAFLNRALDLTAHPSARIRQACVAYITGFARIGLQRSAVAMAAPLDDRSIEATGEGRSGATLSAGHYGIATVYSHLAAPEVADNVFA